jgi:hypothetical protein
VIYLHGSALAQVVAVYHYSDSSFLVPVLYCKPKTFPFTKAKGPLIAARARPQTPDGFYAPEIATLFQVLLLFYIIIYFRNRRIKNGGLGTKMVSKMRVCLQYENSIYSYTFATGVSKCRVAQKNSLKAKQSLRNAYTT